MKATLGCALALSAALLVAAGIAAAGGAEPGNMDGNHAKASSFAPHPRPPGNAYGIPIQERILTKRVKRKQQLRSSPLPAAPSAAVSSSSPDPRS